MPSSVELLQPAYVLHSRPYRESSKLLELFTRDQGRLSLVASRSRSKKNPALPMQPFCLLLIGWRGKGELKRLTQAELPQPPIFLAAERLYSALYLNELLLRILPKFDAYPQVFSAYRNAIEALGDAELGVSQGLLQSQLEAELRRFELHLLNEMGYGYSFDTDAHHGELLDPEAEYRLVLEQGFVRCVGYERVLRFRGADLLAIAAEDFSQASVLQAAKQFSRIALKPLLGERPLNSRYLFQKVENH